MRTFLDVMQGATSVCVVLVCVLLTTPHHNAQGQATPVRKTTLGRTTARATTPGFSPTRRTTLGRSTAITPIRRTTGFATTGQKTALRMTGGFSQLAPSTKSGTTTSRVSVAKTTTTQTTTEKTTTSRSVRSTVAPTTQVPAPGTLGNGTWNVLYLTNADPNSLINDEEAQRICAENAQKELASKLVINIERIQDTKCEEDEETGDMRITHVIIPGVPPTGKVVDDLRKVVSSNKLNPRDANSDISSVVKGSLQLNEASFQQISSSQFLILGLSSEKWILIGMAIVVVLLVVVAITAICVSRRRRRDYPKTPTPTVIGSDRERREERPEGTSRIHDGYYQSEAARPPSVHEQRHSEAEPNNYHYQEEEEQNNVNTMKTEDNHISNHNNYGSDAYSSHRRNRRKSNHDSPAERESERPSSKYRNSKRDANDNDIEAGQVEVYDRIPDAREDEDDDSSSEYTVHYEGRRE